MTQICPGFGVAPVPTLLWLIFRPDGVVVVAPAAWAIGAVGGMSAKAPASAVATAAAATALANGKARILLLLEINCVIVVAGSVVGWAKPTGPAGACHRAGQRTGSACPPTMVGTARRARLCPPYCNQPASATARRASTPTKLAQYSALPWMSPARPSAGIVSPSSDFGENRFLSAASNSPTRNTPEAPAPVTATRTSEGRLATNTPTSAKRDAGLRNF